MCGVVRRFRVRFVTVNKKQAIILAVEIVGYLSGAAVMGMFLWGCYCLVA